MILVGLNMFSRFPGNCVVSINLLQGNSDLKWGFRFDPIDENDTGWQFVSAMDKGKSNTDPDNLLMIPFKQMILIEPRVKDIYHLPVGAKFLFIENHGGKHFYDTQTGRPLEL